MRLRTPPAALSILAITVSALVGLSATPSTPASAAPAIAEKSNALLIKRSDTTVKETLDRLSAILHKKGIKIFARIDHAAGAEMAGMELPPTELLIFGNPKLGTPLMTASRAVGIALPMKALAWQDDDGNVYLGCTNPIELAQRFAITGRDDVIAKMLKAIDALMDEATGTPSR